MSATAVGKLTAATPAAGLLEGGTAQAVAKLHPMTASVGILEGTAQPVGKLVDNTPAVGILED